MRKLASLASLAVATALLISRPALAVTGLCDQSPQSPAACLAAIQALGPQTVVNDVFKDASGKTAGELLPSQFGKLYQQFDGCNLANTVCNGSYETSDDRACPAVKCLPSLSRSFADVASFVNELDFRYANPVRLKNGHPVSALDPACPSWDDSNTHVVDGQKDGYKPWEGMVFELSSKANKVAIFAVNDHAPQPCESTEYTVYLSDNPHAQATVEHPSSGGSDPNKWNRAFLSKVYLQGWTNTRDVKANYRPECGDVADQYAVEADSFTTVYSLPCGLSFRYVAIVVGNDGNDRWDGNPSSAKPLEACNFDSYDGEIDAIAGLTEGGAVVCPDVDRDGVPTCECPSKPDVCDCDDGDASVHPGAPERCDDDVDRSCDGVKGGCDEGLVCHQSTCLHTCEGLDKASECAFGSTCAVAAGVMLCVPADCTVGACPPGSVCDAESKTCVPACEGVVCPQGQSCVAGRCVDPCAKVTCGGSLLCEGGVCVPRCGCLADEVACTDGLVCDRGATDRCVPPSCKGADCADGKVCDAATGKCVDACEGVVCPSDGNPCTDDVCQGGACVYNATADGASCADSNACHGAEVCKAGRCEASPFEGCDDGNPCTSDACDAAMGCEHKPLPDGVACSSGNLCGPGSCKAGVCTAMPGGKDCSDGNPCTTDACDAATGDCKHAPATDGTPCPDDDGCNGEETCKGGVCAPGKAKSCDDGDPCTSDSCDKAKGCVHAPLMCGEGVGGGGAGGAAGGGNVMVVGAGSPAMAPGGGKAATAGSGGGAGAAAAADEPKPTDVPGQEGGCQCGVVGGRGGAGGALAAALVGALAARRRRRLSA